MGAPKWVPGDYTTSLDKDMIKLTSEINSLAMKTKVIETLIEVLGAIVSVLCSYVGELLNSENVWRP